MIKIMVDSSSDCQKDTAGYDLFVPLTVSIGGTDYHDGENLTADRFYDLLTSEKEFPKTSQPSPEDFVRHFEKIKNDGDELICFTLSSALSGTYQSACIAREMVDYEGIYIIDTLAVTHMIGILVGHAAKRIRENYPAEQIVDECKELRTRIKVYAGLDTLEYLHKGGRLSKASATVGEIAGIKPIVYLTEEGTVTVASKAIGIPRAVQTIVTKLQGYELDPQYPVCTLYTRGTENLEKLEKKLNDAGYKPAQRLQVGSTIGAHVGPGVYGIVFVAK